MKPVTPLLVQLPPQQDESPLSLMQRHCKANVAELRDLLRLLSRDTGTRVIDARAVVLDSALLSALEARLNLPSGALSHHHLQPFPGPERRLRQGMYELSRDVRIPRGQPVCPACLADSGYARAAWDFVQAPVCTRHGTLLMTACPDCGVELKASRWNLLSCGECGHDLTDAPPMAAVSEQALTVARLVQSPVMLSAGRAGDTSPLDPQDLSDILRLAALPSPGLPWDYALTGSLRNTHPADLVAALDRVGSALDGRHLDTARLRPVLLQRWHFSALLPKHEQTRLLQQASSLMSMPRDTENLLCFDSEEAPSPTAGALFGANMPRLLTRRQVEEFLQVDASLLDGLVRDGLTLNVPPAEEGHDMDEVLAIQRSLPNLMDLAAVDRIVGFSGLALALAELKLLSTLKTAQGDQLVHPASLSSLLSRISPVVRPRDVEAGMALSEARAFGFDNRQLAWVVSQALSGSLPVIRWDQPYTLASVWVDQTRLTQLADWPKSEPGADSESSSRYDARVAYWRQWAANRLPAEVGPPRTENPRPEAAP